MKYPGVSDLHNEHSSNKNETIHGVTFKDDPNKPNAQFSQHKENDTQGFRDAHDDQDEWTDHKEDSGHSHQSWNLNGTTPSGGKKGEDFWYDDQFHNATDIQDSKTSGTSETTVDDSDQGAFEADFNVDNPGDKHDEEGSLVGQHRAKHQFEEHKGPDYYDSHEETNDQTVASGSFDTYDEAAEAMRDFDEHIDMPESYGEQGGLPFEQAHGKREASGDWVLNNVNRFDVAVSHPQPEMHRLQARELDAETMEGLYVATLIICCVVLPLLLIFSIWACCRNRAARRKAKMERRADQRLAGEGLAAADAGNVELSPVRAQEQFNAKSEA